MVQINIELDEIEEKIVSILKAARGHSSKERAIKDIINEYGENQREIRDVIKKVG